MDDLEEDERLMNAFIQATQAKFNEDFSLGMLRITIIVLAIVLIIAALTVESKWILAGILAWILIP